MHQDLVASIVYIQALQKYGPEAGGIEKLSESRINAHETKCY